MRSLVAELWRKKLLVVATVFVFGVAGVVTGALIEKKYDATVTVTAVLDETNSGFSALSGLRSSGLASLAGITLPGTGRNQEALAVLQSDYLTQQYVEKNNLLPVLFAKYWDASTQRWLTTEPKKTPTLWKANRLFKEDIRRVRDDRLTGMTTLTIRWTDAKTAARWANGLVDLTNEYLRNKAIEEARRNIEYLTQQATKTNLVEAQRAIYSVLQDEINKEMLATGRKEFALRVIDPAFEPELASTPGKTILGLLGVVIGGLLCVIAALGKQTFGKPPAARTRVAGGR